MAGISTYNPKGTRVLVPDEGTGTTAPGAVLRYSLAPGVSVRKSNVSHSQALEFNGGFVNSSALGLLHPPGVRGHSNYGLSNAPFVFPNLRNPGSFFSDATLLKKFYISREADRYLEARMEAVNIFNHANYGPIDNNLNSATFGAVQAKGINLQRGFKLDNPPGTMPIGLLFFFQRLWRRARCLLPGSAPSPRSFFGMNRTLQIWCILLSFASARLASSGQTATLRTTDTQIVVEAGTSAPRLVSLQIPGQFKWEDRVSEPLIDAIEIAGKSAPLHWKFNRDASRVDEQQVSFVYESASPRLRLTWEWRVPVTFGPIEHQTRIENLESQEIWLPLQDSLAFNWQIDPSLSLEHLYVEKGANTPSPVGTHVTALTEGYHWSGTSSTYGDLDDDQPREIIPWSLVQSKDSAQTGWYAGIEFSGRTRISLAREKDSLHGSIGLNPDPGPFRTRVTPGEVFATPTVFLAGFRDGADGAGNVLRRWVRAVLGNPETWKSPNYPLAVNNSWGEGMDVNEQVALRMIHDSVDLGLEMFHIDAGWFRGVGDWYPNPKKFPHGLAPIADNAHKQGLKFGLWVDWTQAGLSKEAGALDARDPKVRGWMVTDLPKDWQPEPFKGQTIDLGVPEAKQWAQHEVERIVTAYHLDMLEHDGYLVAHGCDRSDHPHAAPDPLNKCIYKSWGAYWVDSSNSTDVSYHAVRAYYDIYSKLRKDHPGLLLEICNDGGRMVDFGSAAHGDYFSITDTYDPLSNRRAFYDTSHVLPSAMLESYVEKWPTPQIENFRYMLRSGMMGWLTIMTDTNAWSADQHTEARKEIDLYKNELRPLIRDASLYHVSPRPDGVHWDGIQYWDPERKRGVVYAFRGTIARETTHSFVLEGLEPTGRYVLKFYDHSAPDRTVTGRELLGTGLQVTLPLQNSSELIFVEGSAH